MIIKQNATLQIGTQQEKKIRETKHHK